jgi:hypothetical protein
MINSLSIGNFIWGEIEKGRFSFRHTDMPPDIHFTLSWTNDNNINLHLTRNIGDPGNKPRITLMKWNKALADQFMSSIPALIIGHLFTPASFNHYPRSSRKNIRIIYFDELEKGINNIRLQDKATAILQKYSTIKKKKKLRINPAVEKEIVPLFSSREVSLLFWNNMRSLKLNSFHSATSRCGIIFLGNKKHHFITYNNRCYLLNRRKSLQEFLKIFMKPDLVEGLARKITEAIPLLQQATSAEDTKLFNNPYQLYLE